MDWTTIITALIGFVGGGGVTALFSARSNKKALDLANDSKMYEEYKDYIGRLKEDIAAEKKEKEEFRSQVDQLWNEVHEMKRQLAALESRLAQANQLLSESKGRECVVENCPNRLCFKKS